MIVERKKNREFWLSSIINSFPDILVAATASYFFDDGWLVFIGVFVGLQLVYFAIWLKNSLWIWTRYKLFDKKRGTQHIVDMLRSNNFPAPEEYIESAEMYLSSVASNDGIDMKTRLIASAELGALNYVQATMRMQEFFRLTLIYDESIEKYGRIAERNSALALTADPVEADADENIKENEL